MDFGEQPGPKFEGGDVFDLIDAKVMSSVYRYTSNALNLEKISAVTEDMMNIFLTSCTQCLSVRILDPVVDES